MKFKELLLPVALALITTWAIQYFFFQSSGEQSEQVQSGQSFTAPKTMTELKPRNTEVDFADVHRTKEAVRTEIKTKGAHLIFSTDGSSLEQLEFKQVSSGAPSLKTISPLSDFEKERHCFLVAFPEKTPYFYDLIGKQEFDDKIEVAYQADYVGNTVLKKYTVYKNTYKIDLELEIKPKSETQESFDIRIFFPSPRVKELENNDVISAITTNEKGNIVKVARDRLNIEEGRFAPTLFGTDDRYFVHAMIEDAQGFTTRAYDHFVGKDMIYSILENSALAKKDVKINKWKISFYFGPKEESAMAQVDPRLEQTLDYSGILAPISKFLLYILKLLYSFLKNYGLAIIAMTILVKLILLPFTYRAEEGMKKRAEFDKKLKYIQQKYKDDREALARERAELIKKHGMPGLSGCLPLVLQLPIFIALSRVLSSSIELYKAPFLWIPDLSARDPYYIIAILTALTMASQAITMAGADAKQRVSTLVMALIIGAVTTSLASGLALYIFMFTFLGVIQTPILKLFKRS
jgi:YidC/Oxa1 family membrane protein insertase